jgi:hypothetical protein
MEGGCISQAGFFAVVDGPDIVERFVFVYAGDDAKRTGHFIESR